MRTRGGRAPAGLTPSPPGAPRPGAVRACRRAGTSGTRCGPLRCPAVDTQLGWAGRRARHDDDAGAVGLVVHLGPVDGHRLVVVVVGVEQAVPQAHVPEDALGGAAPDDEGLVVGQLEGAHGVGGVAGGPAEGGGRHRVGRVDGVGRAERDGHDAGLLAQPGRHGPQAARQVGVVLAVGRRAGRRPRCARWPGALGPGPRDSHG